MSRRQLLHQLQLQSTATSEDVWYIWWSLVVPDQSASQSGSPRGQEGVLVRVPHDCSYTWLLRLLSYGFVMRNFSVCECVCVFNRISQWKIMTFKFYFHFHCRRHCCKWRCCCCCWCWCVKLHRSNNNWQPKWSALYVAPSNGERWNTNITKCRTYTENITKICYNILL